MAQHHNKSANKYYQMRQYQPMKHQSFDLNLYQGMD